MKKLLQISTVLKLCRGPFAPTMENSKALFKMSLTKPNIVSCFKNNLESLKIECEVRASYVISVSGEIKACYKALS